MGTKAKEEVIERNAVKEAADDSYVRPFLRRLD